MLLLAGLLVCNVPASAREKERQLSHDSVSSARHPQAGDNNIQNYQTLRCYQAGQEIINVSGLTNLPLPIYIGMRGVFLHKRPMAHCSRCFLKVPMCCAALIKRPQIKLMAENTTCPICGAYIDYLGNGGARNTGKRNTAKCNTGKLKRLSLLKISGASQTAASQYRDLYPI